MAKERYTELDASVTEAQFQSACVEASQRLGWRVAHFRTSMTADGNHMTAVAFDGKGFPDCIFVHPVHRVLLAVEFKSMKGRMSHEQHEWADMFEAVESAAAPHVRYFVWRPNMMDRIIDYLTAPFDIETVVEGCAP